MNKNTCSLLISNVTRPLVVLSGGNYSPLPQFIARIRRGENLRTDFPICACSAPPRSNDNSSPLHSELKQILFVIGDVWSAVDVDVIVDDINQPGPGSPVTSASGKERGV